MLKKAKALIYSIALFLGAIVYRNRNSKVLYYHDVHDDGDVPYTNMSTSMRLFKQHVELIRANGFEIVNEITQPKNQIMLTFDDGYLGVFKNSAYFEENGLKPTIFIITNEIAKPGFMGLTELVELQKKGFIFQSHTHTHPDLNLCSKQELEEEYVRSKSILENDLSITVDAICFPKGFFTNQAVAEAYNSGYKKLYSSVPGSYHENNGLKVIYRNLVQFSSPFDLKCILYGGLSIFKNRYIKQHFYD